MTTRGALLAAALGLGCADGPRRFTLDGAASPGDLGRAHDASDDDPAGDPDAGPDGGRDPSRDGAMDARDDAPRDVAVESAVLGCRTSEDCGSPDLYCNGPGCASPGFCVPRRAAASCAMADASAGDLVCGCDGMTYGALCQLQVDGVRLSRFGLCPRD